MSKLCLIKRNCKLFFKDKGMFFCSLITPIILLILYITFLGNTFKNSYKSSLDFGIEIPEKMLNALAGGQLFSSLISVCCVTVAFCSNMLMVQDKITGARNDLLITPIKKSELAISYYIATFIDTFLICFIATLVSFVYLAIVGWYLSFLDCLVLISDVIVLTLFGTALSSLVNHFLNTQGQVSAVGTIVSSMYGFISGAYMPISSFSPMLQKILMFLPSTYGSSLVRNHALRGTLKSLENLGVPETAIYKIKNSIDCNLFFFGKQVSTLASYLIMLGTIFVLILAIFLINKYSKKSTKPKKNAKVHKNL